VARAALRAHAALRGRRDHPASGEEPGKIVHEWRPEPPEVLVSRGWPADDKPFRYYASADSTCWFLVVLAALGDRALAGELEEAWRAAGGWLERALARGDGLVRYGPAGRPGGLSQQGWRDAVDPLDPRDGGAGILHEDGRMPAHPLADADVQAVAHVALRALGTLSGHDSWRARADALRDRVGQHFDPETMAVEPDGTRVRGAGSQLGWLLWAGALPEGRPREAAAERLCEPDVLTDFGLRTLSDRHGAFDPHAYHRGSVWPFDSWLGWGGLRAAGRPGEAERVRTGVLAALDLLGHAPELYAVEPGGGRPAPVGLSNFVQAWTIGARRALERTWDGRG
jgi:glycogen debranching enzyme